MTPTASGFPMENHFIRGAAQPQRMLLIKCSRCDKEHRVHVKTTSQAQVPEFVKNRFRSAGWEVGASRDRDLCPDCQKVRPSKLKLVCAPAPCMEAELDKALDKPTETTMTMPLPPKTGTTIKPFAPAPAAKPAAPEKSRKIHAIATFKDRMQIHKLLEEHLIRHDDGLYTYAEGWSDARIAKEVNGALNEEHVSTHRKLEFGLLVRGRGAPTVKPGRIALLEKRVADLEEMILKLTVK